MNMTHAHFTNQYMCVYVCECVCVCVWYMGVRMREV